MVVHLRLAESLRQKRLRPAPQDRAVITNDDVAVENSLYTTGRRGVAGTLVVEKIVGAAAEVGMEFRPGADRQRAIVTRARETKRAVVFAVSDS